MFNKSKIQELERKLKEVTDTCSKQQQALYKISGNFKRLARYVSLEIESVDAILKTPKI